MANIEDSVIAKLKKGGKNFEVFVDMERALRFKKEKKDFSGVLVVEDVFNDSKKGEKASEADLKRLFGTDDKTEVAKKIVVEGNVQLTAEYLRREGEMKRKQVVEMIHRYAVDAKTGKPHPVQRIDNAISEAKVKIDNNKSAEEQVRAVVSAISPIIPIKYETREIEVRIPAEFTGKAYGFLRQFAKVLRERWDSDGSLVSVVELPAGLQEQFELKLNDLTRGNGQFKIVGSV